MKRCAIYARFSSDVQSPSSCEDQRHLCESYAARQGWAVVAVFEDAALSGVGVEYRPGYQAMLRAALAPTPDFDVVLVEDVSRLGRDLSELLRLYRRLRDHGIAVVGVSDGISTAAQGGKVMLGVKGLMAELYLDDLRDKTHRGLAGALRRGLSTGGSCFGYCATPVTGEYGKARPARLEVNPAEAVIVRRIFSEYAAGRSFAHIAHALNREGVPAPRGRAASRTWTHTEVRVILRNERYTGVLIWNRRQFSKDPETGRRTARRRDASEWVRQEAPELRIVDADTWGTVQARLAVVRDAYGRGGDRGRDPAAFSGRYLLSGVLRCSVCGARMVGHGNAAGRRYYRCAAAISRGPAVCDHRASYRRDWLEDSLIERFRKATSKHLDALTAAVARHVTLMTARDDERPAELKREVLRLESEAANLVRFLAGGGESSTVRGALAETEGALSGLRVELARAEHARTVLPEVDRGWVEAKIADLDALLRDDPARAALEIRRHLDGDLMLRPLPVPGRGQRVEITGRVNPTGLLATQGAGLIHVVAGARNPVGETSIPFRVELSRTW